MSLKTAYLVIEHVKGNTPAILDLIADANDLIEAHRRFKKNLAKMPDVKEQIRKIKLGERTKKSIYESR